MPDLLKHPTAQQLADFGLGKLSADAVATIHEHLLACGECSRKVENQPPDSFIGQLKAGSPQGGTMLPAVHMPLPSPSNTLLPGRKVAQINKPLDEVPAELATSTKFEILGKLGQGGMGAVFKARHKFLGDHVAIKVMNADTIGNTDARSRFLREMHAAGQLKHPNIVRALDAEQMGDLLVLVMEFVAGITLDQLVAQKGPLPVGFSCNCIMQAALGLQHAHEKKMVHRDIKPANLIITAKEKEVKLLDFGLARGPREQGQKNQTQMQMFMGTPEYVSPEQATDARCADIRADIYSLGCTLYFLLAGRPPFQGATVMETIVAQIQDEPRPLPEVREEVSVALWNVIAKMMAKAPAQRFQTPVEVAEALKPFVAGAKMVKKPSAQQAEVVPPPLVLPPSLAPRNAEESPFAPLDSSPQPALRRREHAQGKRKWSAWVVYVAVAAGVVTMSLFALVVLSFRTPKGKVIVEIDQKDAQVFVDGKKIQKQVSAEMQPIEIRREPVRAFKGHPGAIWSVDLSADGDLAVSAGGGRYDGGTRIEEPGFDNTVRIWEAKTGEERFCLTKHNKVVRAVACSSDGRLALSGSWDETVRLWDTKNGEELYCFRGHTKPVTAVAFLPGNQAVSVAVDESIRTWNVKTGGAVKVFHPGIGPLHCIAVSPDGQLAYCGTQDKSVQIIELTTGRVVAQLPGEAAIIHSVALSPDGTLLASGNASGRGRIWDMKTRQERFQFEGHVVRFLADQRRLFVGCNNGTLKVIDSGDGRTVVTTSGHSAIVQGVALSADSSFALSGSWDGSLNLWKLR